MSGPNGTGITPTLPCTLLLATVCRRKTRPQRKLVDSAHDRAAVASVRFVTNTAIRPKQIELRSTTIYSDYTASRRNLGETMLLPTLIMLMVLGPVILPAIITLVHLLTGKARTCTEDRVAANFPRLAAAAAA
jgi:hypothetical protein